MANVQIVQPQGFTNLNGTGLGAVEGFMNVGEDTLDAPDGFSTPCPVGTRVDGYQVVVGALIYQIRPRCSCINCGAKPCSCSCCQLVCTFCDLDSPPDPHLDAGGAGGHQACRRELGVEHLGPARGSQLAPGGRVKMRSGGRDSI